MFSKDFWPFYVQSLSEIIDKETLEVIEAGCSERIRRPLTIMDYNPNEDSYDRIESVHLKQNYEPFCRIFREKKELEELCQDHDLIGVDNSLKVFSENGEPYREFRCHMGLIDMTHVIQIHGRIVAVVYSGQYCPMEGPDSIWPNLDSVKHRFPVLVDDETEEILKSYTQDLPRIPPNAQELLEREAKHIKRIAEAEYDLQKQHWEEEFLDELSREMAKSEPLDPRLYIKTLQSVLGKIIRFCHCQYIVLFGSQQENDLLLVPIAQAGISGVIAEKLAHFNWRKANLPVSKLNLNDWDITSHLLDLRQRGIRGDNCEFFAKADCILPLSLADRFRCVLVMGPFNEPVNLNEEQRFLTDLANTVGLFALTGLEVQFLQHERHRWQSTARLINHEVRTALTPITTTIGSARIYLEPRSGKIDIPNADSSLKQAEDLAMNLAELTKKNLASKEIILIKPEDMTFQTFPLAVLVGNAVTGFNETAREKDLEIVLHENLEYLPAADVDVARLTIVLANLIDNAIKYSFPGSEILVRRRLEPFELIDKNRVWIEVINQGFEIRQDEFNKIFEQGTRGKSVQKQGKIGGIGYGLWEVRAILRAHDGEVKVECYPTSNYRREERAYKITFTLEIPIHHKKKVSGAGYGSKS